MREIPVGIPAVEGAAGLGFDGHAALVEAENRRSFPAARLLPKHMQGVVAADGGTVRSVDLKLIGEGVLEVVLRRESVAVAEIR